MKFTQGFFLFVNLCFRFFLIVYILKQDSYKKPAKAMPIRHWLDPLSKRVFLILVNGLNSEFLQANSTPYMQNMLDNYGSFAVSQTQYLETNEGGLKTMLTGVSGYSSPIFWARTEGYESLLEYINCKCIMGMQLPDVRLPCYFPYDRPLENFSEFPRLFDAKTHKSCLYIINFNFDPVLAVSYSSRLRKLDDDIKTMATAVDNFWKDNETTYIVTSARGSPVGDSLSKDAPMLAWGKGIANSSEVTNIRPIDITPMLCILLGSLFPTGMRGVFPLSVMDMNEYHLFEMASYTIQHFESVLKIPELKEYLIQSSELELEQLMKRLSDVVSKLMKAKFSKWFSLSIWVILFTLAWSLNLLVLASCGSVHVSLSTKSLIFLAVMILTTFAYEPPQLGTVIAFDVLLWFTIQNVRNVDFEKNFYSWVLAVVAAVTTTVFVCLFGNLVATILFFLPIVFWCFFNGSYRKLNPFVLFTRIASGLGLCFLPVCRTFGVLSDFWSLSLVSFLFLFHFFLVFNSFGQKIDLHTKINILMAAAANLYVDHVYRNDDMPLEGMFSSFFLAFSCSSVYLASGSLLVRLLKIFLALFIPVEMFAVQTESIFYFCIVYHMFTWVFIEHYSQNQVEAKPYVPSLFSLEPDKLSKTAEFSFDNNRHLLFFFAYCHLSYIGMGHHPDLHSYDLYVLPTFVYPFTDFVSYSLSVIKFFIPFFVATSSLIAVRCVQGKDFDSLVVTFLWLMDIASCCLILCSQFINRVFQEVVLPARFSYFIIQQFVSIAVILSYSLSKHLFFAQKRFPCNIFKGSGKKSDVTSDQIRAKIVEDD